jgi:acetaldehyde dehydrogenase (acetylating)
LGLGRFAFVIAGKKIFDLLIIVFHDGFEIIPASLVGLDPIADALLSFRNQGYPDLWLRNT